MNLFTNMIKDTLLLVLLLGKLDLLRSRRAADVVDASLSVKRLDKLIDSLVSVLDVLPKSFVAALRLKRVSHSASPWEVKLFFKLD